MQFYRARSCGSVVAIKVIVEKTLDLCRFGKATQAKHAYGPVTPTSRFCSSFVFNAFGDVARRLWNGIRFLDWQSGRRETALLSSRSLFHMRLTSLTKRP